MESKQATPGVIAQLMGLDNLQSRHVPCRPIKVLSEDYLRKTASIAQLEKSLVHKNRSPKRTAEKQHATGRMFESDVRAQFRFDRQDNGCATNFNPVVEQNCKSDGASVVLKDPSMTRNSVKMSAGRIVPRSTHKRRNSSGQCGAKHLDESSRAHLQSKVDSGNISTRISKPKSEKGQDWLRSVSFLGPDALHQDINNDYMVHGSFLKCERKITENQNASKSVEPLRCKHRDNNVGQTEARSVQGYLRIASRPRSAVGDCTGSSCSSAAKNKKFEQWKNTKDIQEISVSDAHIESRLSGSFSHQENNFSTPSVHSNKVRSANEYLRRLASRTKAKNSSVADETFVGVSKGIQKIMKGSKCYGSSDARDGLSQQKLSHGSRKGELIFTRTAIESMSVKNSREMSQLSPDSVLEPAFKEDRDSEISDSRMLDISGLAMKLLLLESESEDASLKGSVMSVSSDKDTEKGSIDLSQDYEKLWRPWRPEESRDFSYLIDVLDEATLFGLNLDTWCETWQEEENPLSPLVFETLEKKYGKQTSWHKSERRLMFDYINSGLKAIQDSYTNYRSSELPLKRRVSTSPTKSDVEEDLWLQFTREKEVKKDIFEGAVKWLDLEDDISTICKDIAEVLFDELATEICST